jgi:short-subunit dehydrogenase
MVRELKDRRILITGASSGIGRSLVGKLASRGARVILAARSAPALDALAQEISAHGGHALAVPADVTREDDRQRLFETVAAQVGGLDVLVNNAGVASFGHFAESNEDILRQVMEVNFFAPAELMRQAIPLLRQGHQPAIVNVASMCGRRGLPAWPEYSASKFALCGLTEALRGEMARFDIDVLLIVPGLTQTDLHTHMLRNEGRMRIDFSGGMPAEAVADNIARAIERNQTETVLGGEAKWILRVNRFLPRLVDRLMARKVRQLYAG